MARPAVMLVLTSLFSAILSENNIILESRIHNVTNFTIPSIGVVKEDPTLDSKILDVYNKVGAKYYYVDHGSKVNWFAALQQCHMKNGQLASLRDAEELALLSKHLKLKGFANEKTDWFWLAGSDLPEQGKYTWITSGTLMNRSLFSKGKSDKVETERCLHLWLTDGDYAINNWKCTSIANYICEMQPKTLELTFV